MDKEGTLFIEIEILRESFNEEHPLLIVYYTFSLVLKFLKTINYKLKKL